jgi:toxic protein SymE
MADLHSTSERPFTETERKLIVGYRPRSCDRNTPSVTICGKWMRAAGFNIGHHIAVKVMDGCIVLIADSPKEQALIEELRETKKALAEIQGTLSMVKIV